uniref:Inhibitor of growth protein n=1 Tax=Cacopsylla melanoneura TaxID=428564 RepID=A0A8D9ESR6_9HEMI
MLYLEDYIELVEILPQELRDRFTEMRLLDLQSQNSLDQLQNKVNQFYQRAPSLSSEQREKEFNNILHEYNKPVVDSEEKINLATQIQEFLNKYTRKLEQDIQKFKLELEADNSGITEILEKRVTDSQQKENQRSNLLAARNKINSLKTLRTDQLVNSDKRLVNDRHSTSGGGSGVSSHHSSQSHLHQQQEYKYSVTQQSLHSGGTAATVGGTGHNSINYSLSNIGAGGMAITAAASQAIAATQQMKQGRRTASLKASYEAIHGAGSASDMSISKELAGAAQTAIAAIQDTHKKNKKKSSSGGAAASNLSMGTINMNNTSSALVSLMMETSSSNSKLHTSGASTSSAAADDLAQQGLVSGGAGTAGAGEEDMDQGYGPDEPRYCRCNEVAFGVMVACDSKNCPYEWYHCECVGIAPDNPPKGKWYCPLCLEKMAANKSSHGGSSRKHRK